MTNLPKAALLAALMFGTAAATIATPAHAKKKDEAPVTGPQLKINEAVRKGQDQALLSFGKIRPLLAADGSIPPANRPAIMDAINGGEAGIAAAEAAAQTNDELYVTQELRYRKQSLLKAVQAGDPAGQAAAAAGLVPYLDKLLANPVTPGESVGKYAYERGRIAFQANQFQPALAYFQRAKSAGSTEPLIDALIVDSRVKLGDYAGAAADADQMIARMKAAGQKVPEPFYAIGIENAYRSKNFNAAANYEIRRLTDYPDPKNFHDALARLMARSSTTFDLRQRLDVWRLMRATKALADQSERIAYAQDSLSAGAPREAQAVLEEFRAGRPVTQLDPKFAAALTDANKRVLGATPLAKAEADARSGDAQSAQTAGNFFYSASNFAKAAEMYQLADQRGAPDKDAVKLSLGAAQAQAGDKAGATASFQAVTGSPRREIAGFWQAWLTSRP